MLASYSNSFALQAMNKSKKENPGGGKALTFAMRHRALRAACILCPDEILIKVIEDENYMKNKEEINKKQ